MCKISQSFSNLAKDKKTTMPFYNSDMVGIGAFKKIEHFDSASFESAELPKNDLLNMYISNKSIYSSKIITDEIKKTI